ncbi:MAG: stage II sporulation protein M [Candidatus Pacearchaeota archaeon]
MRKTNKNFLITNYFECFRFLNESKNFIYTIIGIFFLFILVGSLVPAPLVLEEKILIFIEELILSTEGMSQSELVKFIFLNNIQASFFGLIFGLFFGIFPFISTVINGYLVGYVAAKSVEMAGFLTLWNLVPHGIFELPALFISLGLGLKLGTFIFEKDKVNTFKNYILNSLRVFFLVVLPLLIIAAIIEGSLIFLSR